MGLFKVIKKNKVPDELPSLSINSSAPQSNSLNMPKTMVSQPVQAQPAQQVKIEESRYKPLPVHKLTIPEQAKKMEAEEGFFKNLMRELTEEIDTSKIDNFYKSNILSEDIVTQMRNYWENQKPEMLLKSIGNELKQKLIEKTNRLHELEKEWQEAYFDLLAKEGRIRDEEKELKKELSELLELYERSLRETRSKKRK